jgi:hypothetical protein
MNNQAGLQHRQLGKGWWGQSKTRRGCPIFADHGEISRKSHFFGFSQQAMKHFVDVRAWLMRDSLQARSVIARHV